MAELQSVPHHRSVRVAGAGAFVPSLVVDNHRLAEAIPGWSAERMEEKTSIRERRYLWDFDEKAGRTIRPAADAEGPKTNADMCEIALRRALEKAGLDASELDAVFRA